jgi:hypothetical protein
MYARTLALATLLTLSAPAIGANYAPGSSVTLEGRVAALEGNQTFWLEVSGQRILVYGTVAQRASVFPGQRVRAAGTISDDFIKMAEVELQARTIEVLARSSVGTTTAASVR